tara:strand:+ start:2144 stop:2323 length:180 start_codon:yes stop_codon:yes gene_type:complete
MEIGKIQLKIVRSFSLGFCIHSPKLNGVCFDLYLGCVHLCYWGKGNTLFTYNNFWVKQS